MAEEPIRNRSVFVTVIAWIFIVYSGFGALILGLQTVMLWSFTSIPEFRESFKESATDPEAPGWFVFIASNFQWIPTLLLAVALGVVGVSVGLLLRKNWARVTFIGMMTMNVLWSVGGAFFLRLFVPEEAWQQTSNDMEPFRSILIAMQAVSVVFTLMSIALSLWIVWKLTRPAIKAEFVTARPSTEISGKPGSTPTSGNTSKDFRIGAVLSGCLTQIVVGIVAFIVTGIVAIGLIQPTSAEELASSKQGFFWATLAISITGTSAGLVTGFKAKGMEIRHALVVMAIPVGIAFVLRVLALKGFIAAPELEPVPFSAHKAWRVVGNLAVWGSVPLGALIAKGIRLRRLAGIRREGLRPCKRCEYAMEISATVCPICGQVV